MHRLIEPGGHLVLTTHGTPTLHDLGPARRSGTWDDLEALRSELYAEGFAYRAVFGPDGDGGVPQEDWGNAFMTLDWLAERACPQWSIRGFSPGRVDNTQDVIVLRREPDQAE